MSFKNFKNIFFLAAVFLTGHTIKAVKNDNIDYSKITKCLQTIKGNNPLEMVKLFYPDLSSKKNFVCEFVGLTKSNKDLQTVKNFLTQLFKDVDGRLDFLVEDERERSNAEQILLPLKIFVAKNGTGLSSAIPFLEEINLLEMERAKIVVQVLSIFFDIDI
tara:strand:+ start:439 stop:921 length:483 start_codon:yes stop_codon:yes gene_type:complete